MGREIYGECDEVTDEDPGEEVDRVGVEVGALRRDARGDRVHPREEHVLPAVACCRVGLGLGLGLGL